MWDAVLIVHNRHIQLFGDKYIFQLPERYFYFHFVLLQHILYRLYKSALEFVTLDDFAQRDWKCNVK
jgi:hypothetical protein